MTDQPAYVVEFEAPSVKYGQRVARPWSVYRKLFGGGLRFVSAHATEASAQKSADRLASGPQGDKT